MVWRTEGFQVWIYRASKIWKWKIQSFQRILEEKIQNFQDLEFMEPGAETVKFFKNS